MEVRSDADVDSHSHIQMHITRHRQFQFIHPCVGDVGEAQLCRLKGYNTKITRLLGDRRLLPFLESRPEIFTVVVCENKEHVVRVPYCAVVSSSSPPAAPEATKGTFQCSNCKRSFVTRNRLYRHLDTCGKEVSEEISAPAGVEDGKRKRLLQKVQDQCVWALRGRNQNARRRRKAKIEGAPSDEHNHEQGVPPVTLKWLCNHSRVNHALHLFTRSAPAQR